MNKCSGNTPHYYSGGCHRCPESTPRYVYSRNQCLPCLAGTSWNGSKCACPSSTPVEWPSPLNNPTRVFCCPTSRPVIGFGDSDNSCHPCTGGYYDKSKVNKCACNQTGYFYYRVTSYMRCVRCPGTLSKNGFCTSRCPVGQDYTEIDGLCCKSGQTPQTGCCKSGYTYLSGRCHKDGMSCDNGYYITSDKSKCCSIGSSAFCHVRF